MTRRTRASPARQQKERGNEALALHQLGVVYAHADLPDVEQAAAHYQQALALAEALGMRPLAVTTDTPTCRRTVQDHESGAPLDITPPRTGGRTPGAPPGSAFERAWQIRQRPPGRRRPALTVFSGVRG